MTFSSLKTGLSTAVVALVAFATLTNAQNGTQQPTKQPHSIFLSPNRDLAFGITVPAESSDIYFTIASQASQSWAAIGFGGDSMPGSLILVLHSNARGDGVTLSPRIATGHTEPKPYPELQVDRLDGSGIKNGTMYFSGRCKNCRSPWPGAVNGGIDVARTDQKMIYAVGPRGSLAGDAGDAPMSFHGEYGSFTMDLRAATAGRGLTVTAPVLDKVTADDNEGATLVGWSGGKRVWATLFHAIFMVGTFIGLLPMGLVIIRVGEWARWHAVNQTFALVLVLIAFGLGIKISTLYNRTMNFRDPHQVIGFIVVALMLGQFFLGFFHHRTYKKTKAPTKLAIPHVWLGRLVMVLGVVNAFLGFHLAMSPRYMIILGGLVIAIVPLVGCILMGKAFLRRRKERAANAPPEEHRGYDAEPWVNAPPAYTANATTSGGRRGDIGLADMGGRRVDRTPDLGGEQHPRPIV